MRLQATTIRTPYRAGRFAISGTTTQAATSIIVRAVDAANTGWGEAVPDERVLGTTEPEVLERLESAADALRSVRLAPEGDPPASPIAGPGPAACAVDGALLDAWAHARGEPVWKALGLPRVAAATTGTVSLDTATRMADEALRWSAAGFSHLKVKLGEDPTTDLARIQAIRAAVPRAALRIDGNEGWDLDTLVAMAPGLSEVGVDLVEQPLPRDAGQDDLRKATALCADHDMAHVLDEAVHDQGDVARVGAEGLAHGINLKLQKAGGLRPGLAVVEAAEAHGLKVLIGCYLETWAGIGLGVQLGGRAAWLDLDGAWLLADEPVRPVDAPFLNEGVLRAADTAGLGVTASATLQEAFDGSTTSL